LFGLVISGLNSDPTRSSNTYGNAEPLQDKAGGRAFPYFYGLARPKNLEFPLEIYNKHGTWYEQFEVQAIEEWLFGHVEPKLLTIFDPDKGNQSYECWLTGETQIVRIDKRVMGWRFNVVCTSPFVLGDRFEATFDCTQGVTTFDYFNLSNIKDFIYPELIIKLQPSIIYIRIDSEAEPNRPFIIAGARAGETITVNNYLGYMTTASGDRIIDKFNMNFFRLKDGHNFFRVNGRSMVTIRSRVFKTGSGY